ncbi:MAG: S1 family peptidase [Candidatus Promineofilum sp.]|nr:S1 family peptidase [Promineifilum sp.]MCW5862629.1 hypothetical protein [Anaerolineae bacterium]
MPPLTHPERLKIGWVRYSEMELKNQYDYLRTVMPQYPELQAVYILWKQNRVGVMISGVELNEGLNNELDKSTLSGELRSLLASPLIVVYEGEIRSQFTAIRGGDSWGRSKTINNCTIGFEVQDVFKRWGMLTAGHCIEDLSLPVNARLYHGKLYIGTVSEYVRNGGVVSTDLGVDGAVILSRSSSTARDDVYHFGEIRDITGPAPEAQIGWFRCMTGMTSGSVCGYVTCTHGTYRDADNLRYYNDLLMIDITAQPGDSGAPIYRTDGTKSALIGGIANANVPPLTNCTNSWDVSASKWSNLSSYFHLTLVTR